MSLSVGRLCLGSCQNQALGCKNAVGRTPKRLAANRWIEELCLSVFVGISYQASSGMRF